MKTTKATTAKDVEVAANTFADAARQLILALDKIYSIDFAKVMHGNFGELGDDIDAAKVAAEDALTEWEDATAALVATDASKA